MEIMDVDICGMNRVLMREKVKLEWKLWWIYFKQDVCYGSFLFSLESVEIEDGQLGFTSHVL